MKVRDGNAHIPRDQTVGTDLDALLGHDERAVKQSKITDHSRAVFSNGKRAASVTRDVIPDAHGMGSLRLHMAKNLRRLTIKAFTEVNAGRDRMRPPITLHSSICANIAHVGKFPDL